MMFERVRNFESISDNHEKRKQKIRNIHDWEHFTINNVVPHITESTDSGSFYHAIKPVIMFGQLFGLFPMDGISNNSSRKLTFKWKSLKMFYSIFIILTISFLFLTAIIEFIQSLQGNPSKLFVMMAALIYYCNALMATLQFVFMCPMWIKLQQKWTWTESRLKSFGDKNLQLRYKFMTISLIMIGAAVIEHCLHLSRITVGVTFDTINLMSETYNNVARIYNLETVREFSKISFFRYAVILYLFVANKFCTIIWNVSDLFIVLVATGLAERYKHLNELVINSLSNRFDAINWHQCRKKYALLSNLVKETDNLLSPLILLSYSTNLYFICLQLFNGIFDTADGNLSYVYSFMSFILILGRIFAITLSAARIHNQSTIILPKIYCCPSSSFNSETKRLQYQLTDDEVTLTGMKFFSITRNFMLALVGATVTYELIILQFGQR